MAQKRQFKSQENRTSDHSVTVYLTGEQKKLIKDTASRVGRSMSDVARQLLDFKKLPDVRGY